MRESALVIYRDELISVSHGGPGSVEFNFDQVWAHRKAIGKRFEPGLLFWVHVHPPGFGTQPSSVDLLCAMALRAAFGMVEHFGIMCFSNGGFKDIRGVISWYRLNRNNQFEKLAEHELQCDNTLIEEEVFMLKALSYGESWSSASTASEPSVAISSSN
jgi:hypothetical protein